MLLTIEVLEVPTPQQLLQIAREQVHGWKEKSVADGGDDGGRQTPKVAGMKALGGQQSKNRRGLGRILMQTA